LDCNKMLAIITYKNIFPKDFSELQLNKGYIYTLFEKKPEFFKTETTVIERKISEIEIKINSIKTEYLKSPGELELIYNPKIQKLRQTISQNHYNQATVKQNQTELDSLIQERDRRLESITIKENDEIDVLNEKISNYKGELSDIKNRKLKEVITRENVDNIF
ncbi:TPA: hypothetical protein MYR62_005369, partial [Klebsiella pneumoniae]|nr:hypothetical protein [Klebsiella pneumoniae]